jgi:hypothetical protein
VDAHHARVAVGDSLAIRVSVEKGLHILILVVAGSKSKNSLFLKDNCKKVIFTLLIMA